jgi:hypothetical protein
MFSQVLFPLALLILAVSPSLASTVVHFGSIKQISRAADLDLDGDFVYAVNFSADDPVRVVRGVRFQPDRLPIPGAAFVGPQQVTPWQTKPEFGASADDNELEQILHDIRWASSGAGETLRATLAVIPGETYKLQLLISANNNENRRWDIRVGGQAAVDEITSLGSSPGQTYAVNRATLYTCQWTATHRELVIQMGTLFGGNDGGDRNPIWQALTLEKISFPPSPDDIALDTTHFFARQQAPVGGFKALDGKTGATHLLTLAPGPGDADNSKFTMSGTNLFVLPLEFSSATAGTTYQIRVRATDTADPGRFVEKPFLLTLAPEWPPTNFSLDVESLSSLAKAGTLAATLSASDLNAFDKHQFALVEGPGAADNPLFEITDRALRLSRNLPADRAQVTLRIKATDLVGLSYERAVVLPVRPAQVSISEALSGEEGGLADEYSRAQDWIELRNHLAQWVDLTGFYLTDSKKALQTWRFPGGAIPPGGHLIVLADGLAAQPNPATFLHASFKLNSGGEWMALVGPDGREIVSQLSAPAFLPGVSYGVGADGREGYFSQPTPGEINGVASEFGVNQVAFSLAHGFYQKAFSLELKAGAPGSVIRYTLDGSRPTVTSGTIYSGPFTVSPATAASTRGVRIVRALAVNAQAAYAPVATQTYLFVNGSVGPSVDGVVAQAPLKTSITRDALYGPLLDDALLALPVVSMILPGGPNTSERLASLEFIEPEGEGFQIDCGVNATGTSSLGSPKLSMAAKFRLRYGAASLKYPVFAHGSRFPANAVKEFKELRLRGHSHDTFYWLGTRENPPVPYGNPPVTRSGDAQYARNLWIEEMQWMMGQPGKHGRQAHLYLNGAYHGIYHIQEHPDEDYMASYYPGGSDAYHWTGAALTGSDHGANDSWREVWSQLKSSLNNFNEAGRWIDLTNLCDYMVLSFYAGNDWDWTTQHNWSAAGPKSIDQGGWKFFAQDSDLTLQDVNADSTDQDVPDGIFTALMRLRDFRVLFRDRVYKHCFNGGALTPERAGAFYDDWMNELFLPIIAETARWQPSSSVAALPWDRNQEWINEWNYLQNTFFPQRTAKLLQQLRQRSGWWPSDPPAGNSSGGAVPAGFNFSFTPAPGSIRYTLDGSDPRLPGGAINPAALSASSGSTESPLIAAGAVWRFLDTGTDPGTSWKEPEFDDSLWRSGPAQIGYGDGDEATVARFVDTDPGLAGLQRNVTTYFRRVFDAPAHSSYTSLRMRLVRDDGAVVYLNGNEVWRSNMPEGIITSRTLAVAGVGGTDESFFFESGVPIAQAELRAAGNVLAVEIHQQSPGSSDISFDFELLALSPGLNSSFAITTPTLVKARTYSNGDWSALAEVYLVPDNLPEASAANLILAEIYYHPLQQATNEFLEFLNTSSSAMDLSGVTLTNAMSFRFPRGTALPPGERIVVAKEMEAFRALYQDSSSPYFHEGIRVVGPWEGSLANSGEEIVVLAPDGERIFSCAYGSSGPWPGRANGKGSSLELMDPAGAPLDPAGKSRWLAEPAAWRSSSEFYGTPGRAGSGPDERAVINELLAASAPPDTDAIELKNTSAFTLDLGGWFLSDSSDNYRKYRLPTGTRLAPGAMLVLREQDFNNSTNPNSKAPFALSAQGENVYLVEATEAGALLRLADRVEFGASPIGTSLGRWPDGTGPFVWLQTQSFGQPNSAPVTGYPAWAATAFNPGTTPEMMTPTADPDFDGLNNFSEYAFASPPLKPSAPPLSLGDWQGDEQFVFNYRLRSSATDLRYLVEFSSDLVHWITQPEQIEELTKVERRDGSTVVTCRLAPPFMELTPFQFIRIRVVPKQ